MNNPRQISRESGFTVVELMLVIVIIGLVTALGYPQYQMLSRTNLRQTSLKMAGTIRYIYAKSVLEKKHWRLAIDITENQIWAERLEPAEDGAGMEYKQMKVRGLDRFHIPQGVIIRDVQVAGRDLMDSGVEYINFDPYGGVERASIRLQHRERRWVFTLATKPMTGRVAVFDHDEVIDLTHTGYEVDK